MAAMIAVEVTPYLVDCRLCHTKVSREEADTDNCPGCVATYDRDYFGSDYPRVAAATAATPPPAPRKVHGAPRKGRNLPRYEGISRERSPSPGPPAPAFQIQIPAAPPAASLDAEDVSPAASLDAAEDASPNNRLTIMQRCDNGMYDGCGIFIALEPAEIPNLTRPCAFCGTRDKLFILEEDFINANERDLPQLEWYTWKDLIAAEPDWFAANLYNFDTLDNLDWGNADPSWSHFGQYDDDHHHDHHDHHDDQELYEDLYDDYTGEHPDFPCLEPPAHIPIGYLNGCDQCISPREGTSHIHPHAPCPRFSCEVGVNECP